MIYDYPRIKRKSRAARRKNVGGTNQIRAVLNLEEHEVLVLQEGAEVKDEVDESAKESCGGLVLPASLAL